MLHEGSRIESIIEEDWHEIGKYTQTPPYYVFQMYRSHMGGRLVPMQTRVESLSVQVPGGVATMPKLSGSASVNDNRLTVTLTNPSLDASVSVRTRLIGGARANEGRATVLTHSDMQAGNTFRNPDKVRPSRLAVKINGQTVQVNVPKQSVVVLELKIV